MQKKCHESDLNLMTGELNEVLFTLQDTLSGISAVKYVDILEGDAEGYIRFNTPKDATAILAARSELHKKHNWNLEILTGQEILLMITLFVRIDHLGLILFCYRYCNRDKGKCDEAKVNERKVSVYSNSLQVTMSKGTGRRYWWIDRPN